MLHGEAASILLESLPAKYYHLQQVISKFDSEDVFNTDETKLFYYIMPNHTLTTKATLGKKIVNIVCCNAVS